MSAYSGRWVTYHGNRGVEIALDDVEEVYVGEERYLRHKTTGVQVRAPDDRSESIRDRAAFQELYTLAAIANALAGER